MPNVSSLSLLTLQNQLLNWKWKGLYNKINKSLYILRVSLKEFYKQDYNHFTACDSNREVTQPFLVKKNMGTKSESSGHQNGKNMQRQLNKQENSSNKNPYGYCLFSKICLSK